MNLSIQLNATNIYKETFLQRLSKIFSFDLAEDQENERKELEAKQESDRKARDEEKARLQQQADDAKAEADARQKEADDKRKEAEDALNEKAGK